MIACETDEPGMADAMEEEVRNIWQEPTFNLKTDAWVIVTNKGQVVGYAQVRRDEHEQFVALSRVHPAYHGRGIGTLLIWLVEERARYLTNYVSPDVRVTLSSTVSSANRAACRLLEREGYTVVRNFWRLIIEMDEMPAESFDEFYQHGKLKVDLVVNAENLMGTTQLQKRTGMYVAHQYVVYEKELRSTRAIQAEEQLESGLSACW
jgi:GNAT superfamily N-acetyltransferase